MGIPRQFADDPDFIQIRISVVNEVGFDAAVLLSRLQYRLRDNYHPDGYEASYEQLAQETSIHHKRIAKAAKVLINKGWIERRRKSAHEAVSVWSLVWEDPQIRDSRSSQNGNIPDPPKMGTSTVLLEHEELPTPLPPSVVEVSAAPQPDELFTLETPPARLIDLIASDFAEWYALYPRHDDRKAAHRAYTKARKTHPHQTLMDGLRRHLPMLQAEHQRGFCKYPATWLNGECWNNEVREVRAHQGPVDYMSLEIDESISTMDFLKTLSPRSALA